MTDANLVTMDTSSSDESTGTCSYDGDVSVAIPDIIVESNVTEIFTELLELKKYEDGYQVLHWIENDFFSLKMFQSGAYLFFSHELYRNGLKFLVGLNTKKQLNQREIDGVNHMFLLQLCKVGLNLGKVCKMDWYWSTLKLQTFPAFVT